MLDAIEDFLMTIGRDLIQLARRVDDAAPAEDRLAAAGEGPADDRLGPWENLQTVENQPAWLRPSATRRSAVSWRPGPAAVA